MCVFTRFDQMKEILDESVTEAEIDHRLGRMKASYVEINKRKEDIRLGIF